MTPKLWTVFALAMFPQIFPAQLANSHTPAISLPAALVHPVGGMISTNHATINARTLFLKNCAHCHGADARGDDGPDLHDLNLGDDSIANRIRKGKAGEMTAFAGKLQPAEIHALVVYVQALK